MPIKVGYEGGRTGNDWGAFFDLFPVDIPGGEGLVLQETPSGLVNSSNEDYTTAANFSKLWVWLNGVRMTINTDYTITNSNTFHFLFPPTTGDILRVDYIP